MCREKKLIYFKKTRDILKGSNYTKFSKIFTDSINQTRQSFRLSTQNYFYFMRSGFRKFEFRIENACIETKKFVPRERFQICSVFLYIL